MSYAVQLARPKVKIQERQNNDVQVVTTQTRSHRKTKRIQNSDGADALHTLFEAPLPGVGRISASGRWLSISTRLCRMLGYSQTELLGRPVEEITYPDDWIKETGIREAHFSTGEDSYEINKRYICRTGVLVWVKEISSIVRESDGTWFERISLIQVDEAKRLESIVRFIVHESTNPIIVANQKGDAVLANAHVGTMFGYCPSEIVGEKLTLFLPEMLPASVPSLESPDTVRSAIGNAWRSKGVRKDGTSFPVDIRMHPIETRRGVWILSSIKDSTDRQHRAANLGEIAGANRG